jgi:putrescine transport system permease protein
MKHKSSTNLAITAGFIFAFLYIPILVLVIFSFNSSPVMGQWEGFSWKWYIALFKNELLLEAGFLSIKIASMTATLAVILGLFSSLILVRYPKMRGSSTFKTLLSTPLVLPDMITGLSLLLFFVGTEQLLGWPQGRGVSTIIIAHTTLCMAYVVIIIKSRLEELDPLLEEAALDLGAKPGKVFSKITLPIILPSLLSAWILAFTLSLDDVVLASFVAGPNSTTLPMYVFSKIRLGLTPEINALASVIILFISVCIGIAGIILYVSKKRTS